MDAPSPYGPDHSLLHAVFVLLGGLGLVAVGAYLLSGLDPSHLQSPRAELSDAQSARSVPGAQQRRVPTGRSGGGQLLRAPAPVGGGVPSWAGSGDGALSPRARAPQGSDEIDPDFGAADLGAPSAPAGTAPGGGTATADAGGPTGGAPQAGSTPSAPDLGGGSSGSATAGSEKKAWRSEAQALASRSRALSGALGRIDRQRSREASRSGSKTAEGESEEATTASGTGPSTTSSPPGTPEEPPQVPLGGTEWLAAAGAAYALNRLRKEDSGEADDEE